tara:strand:+ start:509 stop:706 length:198 start_codon:yes stop_codon:yes gene_type:complete
VDSNNVKKMRQCSVETAGFMDEVTNSHSRPLFTPKQSASGEYYVDYEDDQSKSDSRSQMTTGNRA